MRPTAWILVAIGTTWLVLNLALWTHELRFLRGVLKTFVPSGRIGRREDLVRIKNYLSSHIRFDVERRNEPRPLLRSSAVRTLTRGEGFCGENARVAMWLLGLGRIRSHRVYLEGVRWQHTLVEHQWDGGWKFFDAHADPATLLPDEAVGRLESSDFSRLPAHAENPYVRAYRIKPFHRIKALRPLEQTRLPELLALLFESPRLIHALGGALATSAGLLWLRLG